MEREPGLIEGFFLCLRDSGAIRAQTSRWKRSLLVFSSGVCLEIGVLPLLIYWTAPNFPWPLCFLAGFFVPLGLLGVYASRFGDDRLVERLLIIEKLDLRI